MLARVARLSRPLVAPRALSSRSSTRSCSTSSSSGGGGGGGASERELRAKVHPLAPKRLADLLVLDKVADKAAMELSGIWDAYHASRKDCVSASLSARDGRRLEERAKEW